MSKDDDLIKQMRVLKYSNECFSDMQFHIMDEDGNLMPIESEGSKSVN